MHSNLNIICINYHCFFLIDVLVEKESSTSPMVLSTSQLKTQTATVIKKEGAVGTVPEELFVPGTVYYLKRNVDIHMSSKDSGGREFFTLWKRHLDEHFQRIVLSSNLISDHKCDSHFYALRDVLKGLPGSRDDHIFPYSQNTN